MKWKHPNVGERRVVRRFAIFPVRCDDGISVWLGWYWRTDRWGTYTYNPEGDFAYAWIAEEWSSNPQAAKEASQ